MTKHMTHEVCVAMFACLHLSLLIYISKLRWHDFTLVKGQNGFFQEDGEWNKLMADCVHSSSVNMFKNRIDNYLVRAGSTLRFVHVCGLSISQRLPCPQPSELLLGWQSC